MSSDEVTVKTTPLHEGPHGDKDSEGLKQPADIKPLTNPVADLSGTGAKYQVDETQSTRLRLTKIKHTQALMQADLLSLKSDTSKIKSMMTKIFQAFQVINITPPEPQVTQRKGKGITTEEQLKPSSKKLLTEEQIQDYLDKEEQIKKAAEEAKMFEMTKTEVIKVVQVEAKKITTLI
ncbi:hypothetical protein Tco_0888459 [Tanacetum coccineum]